MGARRIGFGTVRVLIVGVVLVALVAAYTSSRMLTGPERVPGGASGTCVVPAGIHKIKHVIIVMQENRSFDSYFGTFPGAAGIPMKNGTPTVCIPKPGGGCTRPYHDRADINSGGPHSESNAIADVNGGKMTGFIRPRFAGRKSCHAAYAPTCNIGWKPEVMGYHTAAEIPNYWTYAKNFVLQDHMFEPVKSWSLPDHLYMVSAWSAKCKNRSPMSCRNNAGNSYGVNQFGKAVERNSPPA